MHELQSISPACEARQPEQGHGYGGDLIAGNRTEDLWRYTEKFMKETEGAVGDQVKMKVLARQDPPSPEEQRSAKCCRVED